MTNLERIEQFKIFRNLPDDTRAYLLQLAGLKRHIKGTPVYNAEVIAPAPVIMLAICKTMNVSAQDLTTPSRETIYTWPRFMACHLLYGNSYFLEEIGRLFNRHHATAMHARDQHADMMFTDVEYRHKYNLVLTCIKQLLASDAPGAVMKHFNGVPVFMKQLERMEVAAI